MSTEIHLSVRAGTHDDIERCAQIWYNAQAARNPARTDEHGAAIARTTIGRRAETKDAIFIVGEVNGEVAALAIGIPAREHDGAGAVTEGVMHVNSVAVDPQFWGHGIGEEVLERLFDQARKHGYTAAQLWMHEGNTRAERLYKHFGFVPGERVRQDDHRENIRHYATHL